ncbi:MAG: hypothetical protein AB7T58_09055, partial [Hyphomonadaceae bacterium]
PVALGVALAALTVAAASAQSSSRHVIVRGGHADVEIDANDDGWITRSEASSAFERIFADLDSNDDGRLDGEDRREIRVHVDGPDVRVLEGGRDGRHVRVIRNGEEITDEEEIEREVERAMAEAERHMERAERDAERAEREAERIEREAERHAERAARHAERAARDAERHVQRHVYRSSDGDREVIVVRGDDDLMCDDGAPVPPVPAVPGVAPMASVAPVPPVPPLPRAPHFMMLIANSEEADLNGDGALSREEFVAQHLRFFDASDANGDGRIRFEEPPAPPAPPEPPRRR